MEYYFYLLISFFVMLSILKLFFAEIEGRQARKLSNIRYFLKYSQKFEYRRQTSIIFITIICYMLASTTEILTALWVLEMLGFVAVGVISDALSQLFYHYYVQFRFKKDVQEAGILKTEVEEAMKDTSDQLMQTSLPSYDSHEVSSRYMQDEKHLAIVSVDGGEFVSQYHHLPPITYVVEANPSKAKDVLEGHELKVTTLTQQGKMPFKDEKIDVIVNELANYDKFEMYRVLKPGGYLVIDQMGSENYKEIMKMFIPFQIKGEWNKNACQRTLRDIGFDIIDGFEDIGHIRFETMPALIAFMKTLSPERVEKYEQFINFYATALKQIKEKHFYDLTTHRFMVIARKKD